MISLKEQCSIDTGKKIMQCRAFQARLADKNAFIAAYSSDFDVDPYVQMFFFPEDTLKLMMFTEAGEVLWQKDLGKGVVPGQWFCPFLPFDLDGDGVDEIYYVGNTDPSHPLGMWNYVLVKLNGFTGEKEAEWKWSNYGGLGQPLSHLFRNFIMGGYVHGEPVLVTAQGTYKDMYLQCFNTDMSERWRVDIAADSPGARGSHMNPVLDINFDGVDELMWGERCFSLDDGTELFCCDRDSYRGHSDVIQPIFDHEAKKWCIFTCRENDPDASPRIVMFDDMGNRMWGDVDKGHIDIGWAARINSDCSPIVMGIKIGAKTCGPDGRFQTGQEVFAYSIDGTRAKLPVDPYKCIPVDLNGDGYHEFVAGAASGQGEVYDTQGNLITKLDGQNIALAKKLIDRPGEQLITYGLDGKIRIIYDENAIDSEFAKKRYAVKEYITSFSINAAAALGGI